ncbi:MAG: ChuX/HutX family heme-like substrate-binding protein [Pseudomonadota bacterium]
MVDPPPTADQIRLFRESEPKMRERDIADKIGVSEAQLTAAYCGFSATRIDAHPDTVMGAAQQFGEVMALTRNLSCVHEKIGRYENYHPGQHAAMVLADNVDLRIFPKHWRHAYMVEKESDAGVRRSLQVFDAAGDAVHKIFLRPGSDQAAFARCRTELATEDQSPELVVQARIAPEAPKSVPEKLEILRKEWQRMTDTHQFLRLVSKLKMNRLGAYRIAGEPFARELAPDAVNRLLGALQQACVEVMLFVGNKGCIQIHTGSLETLKPMGPWQNVLDPTFNLHLRLDHVAEVWAVGKPTQRGLATSVEAFDRHGMLIFQVFGVPKEGRDSRAALRAIVDELEGVAA